jgi:hypothetical protein
VVAACAGLAWTATAHAQDKKDDEAEALRKAAETEADKDKDKDKDAGKPPKRVGGEAAAGLSEEEKLRAEARLAAQDEEERDRGPISRMLGAVSAGANAFNPRMVVAGDILGRLATNREKTVTDGVSPDDRFFVREMELDLRADIDPYAKGVAIISVSETDPGQYGVDIEEGYLTLDSLPASFKLQLGRVRVPFGRMNALHTHDLPQSTRPYFIQDLFGEDGYNDNAAVLSWLAPIPITLTAAILGGENEKALMKNANRPAVLGRAEGFWQMTDTTFASLGVSYLTGWTDVRGPIDRPKHSVDEAHYGCADLTIKWQPNKRMSLVFLTEAYRVFNHEHDVTTTTFDPITGLTTTSTSTVRDRATGVFTFVQFQPLERWYFGGRFDWSDYDSGVNDNQQWAASGWVSFYTTEFLRFRVGFEHRERRLRGDTPHPSPNDTLFFEVTFVFGAHPAEPFWVNK